ncbi:MAG TPA: VWA domain-containing protein [Thermoanaerobaculia bacterium]|nr:VWA domain-containing protein [Thermoanaerobaculia bacterium]
MKRLFALLLVAPLLASSLVAASLEITQKPRGLIHGILQIPVDASSDVARVELLINGIKEDEKSGRAMVFSVPVGNYIRRLRLRAVGYDSANRIVAEDEMVVNDPQPPFRVHLQAPGALSKAAATAELIATVTAGSDERVEGVDFFVGEEKIGTAPQPPYHATFNPSLFKDAPYARATARAAGGLEANDIHFWTSNPTEQVDVVMQQIPVTVKSAEPLRQEDLTLIDSGKPRAIQSVVRASEKPLRLIVLIDSSESMLKELPVVRQAVRQFARSVLGPNDQLAVVKFSQQAFWLTPFTADLKTIDDSLNRLQARGETHLYDTVIEMMFELQKQPGRKALVILTDGIDQGSTFTLDNLVHYARYSGIPIYPIVKNQMLSRMMHFPFVRLRAAKFAETAQESGATYFIIQNESELPAVYSKIRDELAQQYILSFQSESDGRDVWHPLALEWSKKGEIRTPRGYFP